MAELPDSLKKTIGFRPTIPTIDPACITFLQNAGEQNLRSEWISRACQMLYDYEHNKGGFIIRIMQNHYDYCKHILRKLGRIKKLEMK